MTVEATAILEDLDGLPPVPRTLQAVLHNLDRVAASAKSLEAIIKQDPILAARVLHLASSPLYSGAPVTSLERAVVVLGFEELRNLVIGLSLASAFDPELSFGEFKTKDIWLHSVLVAEGAKMLATAAGDLDQEELYTAGLIHDIGRFVMLLSLRDKVNEALALIQKEGIGATQAEERVGAPHWELGAALLVKWGFDEALVSLVRYHHHPQSAGPQSKGAAAIYLADQLAQRLGFGWHGDYPEPRVFVPKYLGLEMPEIKKVAAGMKAAREAVEETWSQVLK